MSSLPTDPKERKNIPICRGVFDYFPAALAEVAKVSKAGNDQHNPGQEMHHAREKSSDHADAAGRHLLDRGTLDTDGQRHSAKLAWRALALLQEELEAEGAPLARGAKPPEQSKPAEYEGCCDMFRADLHCDCKPCRMCLVERVTRKLCLGCCVSAEGQTWSFACPNCWNSEHMTLWNKIYLKYKR